MLTKKQVREIREHLSNAQNPLFFFDNDPDGLCAFLLLQRFLKRGKGIPIRSFPELNVDYFRRAVELDADYIFILDKPRVSEEFWEEVKKVNLPVVWIDHHDIEKTIVPDFVNYYNPIFNRGKTTEPVTTLCYQIVSNEEDLWIAVAGSISDKFTPDFYSEFKEKYPDLSVDSDDAFDIFYRSEIGKIVRIFSFALKDRVTNVINMLKFLMKVKSPYEVLEDTSKNYTMHARFKQIDVKYQKLIQKAKVLAENSDRFLFFKYSGETSMSSDLANELSYLFSGKIVSVIYVSGAKANISVRGKKVRDRVLSAINSLEGASGGGHEDAVGAQIRVEDIEKFKENMMLY